MVFHKLLTKCSCSQIHFPNHHVVKLNYPSFEIEVKTVVRQVDVYQFVSFFGGSLGLFLGFAIYDTLLHAFKLALKLWEKRKSMRLIDLELMWQFICIQVGLYQKWVFVITLTLLFTLLLNSLNKLWDWGQNCGTPGWCLPVCMVCREEQWYLLI